MQFFKTILLFFVCFTQTFAQTSQIINTQNRDFISLNGNWNYIVDPYETGYYDYRYQPHDQNPNPSTDAFFLNSKPKNKNERVEYDFDKSPTLKVPGDWNSQKENLEYYEGTIWYRKLFNMDELDSEKRYFIHFGAVNYRADVYLNGKKVGVHEGGFTPFNFEVTDKLLKGKNFLIVKADNKRKKEAVPTLNTDWWNYGGITRDVKLIKTPQTFIRDYFIRLDENAETILADIQLDGNVNTQKVNFSVDELNINALGISNENGKISFQVKAKKLELWSPQNPKLYDVQLSVNGNSIKDKIGFKTIKTAGSKLLLNNKSIFLKGICIHEENPLERRRANTYDDAKLLLSWAKELGCNYVRLAHYPHNEYILKAADEMGILVWEEIPVYWTIDWTNPDTYQNAENQLSEMIIRDRNHASTIIWSLANETPVTDERVEFLKKLGQKAKTLDNTRLISAALEVHDKKGSPNTKTITDPFAQYVDVVSFNQYLGWYGNSVENLKNIKWDVDFNKPVLISEFGAGAKKGFNVNNETIWSEEFQENLYIETLKMLDKIPQLSGISPWILADFRSPRRVLSNIQDGWNRKGLISDKGEKKKAFFVLKQYYKNK